MYFYKVYGWLDCAKNRKEKRRINEKMINNYKKFLLNKLEKEIAKIKELVNDDLNIFFNFAISFSSLFNKNFL